jgi:transposase-like protein
MAYIILTVSFDCPYCRQSSREQLVAETECFDSVEAAKILSRQAFHCQLCSRTLPDGASATARAEFATLRQLQELGFPARIN